MNVEEIKKLIEQNLSGSKALVTSDDGHHFAAEVIWDQFAGKSLLEQHQLVYQAIGDAVGNAIHALSIETKFK